MEIVYSIPFSSIHCERGFSKQNIIKTDLKNKIPAMVRKEQLLADEKLYNAKLNEANQLQNWLTSPARAQELVEEKERQLRGNIPARNAESIMQKVLPTSKELATLISKENKNLSGINLSGSFQ